MTAERPIADRLTRRTALCGVAGVGAVPLLVACGSDEAGTATDSAASPSSSAASGSASASADASAPAASESAAGPEGLVTTTDIEVGGGQIFSDEEVVIVQPADGEFKGYSAVCPHQGCLVGSVTAEGIVCPCHNSVFALEDGAPTSGPAESPLEEVQLTVTGDQITLA